MSRQDSTAAQIQPDKLQQADTLYSEVLATVVLSLPQSTLPMALVAFPGNQEG
jgi:hypothetical protein